MNVPLQRQQPGMVPPTNVEDDWARMGYHVLRELDRMNAQIERLSDKIEELSIKGAVTHAKLMAYGALGGSLGMAALHLITKLFVG